MRKPWEFEVEIIKKTIKDKKPESLSEHFSLHKWIEGEKAKRKVCAQKTIKIAILSSFTISKGDVPL